MNTEEEFDVAELEARAGCRAIHSVTAARGAMRLDGIDPDWYTKVDVANLVMSDPRQCICGQVFVEKITSRYGSGYDWALNFPFRTVSPHNLGFVVDGHKSHEDKSHICYEILAECWIQEIKDRCNV